MTTRPTLVDLGVGLNFRTNLFLGTKEAGEKILRLLINAGGFFVPEVFDGGKLTRGKKVRFDARNLDSPLRSWTQGRYSLGIIAERRRPLKVFTAVDTTDFAMFDFVSVTVSLDRGGLLDHEKVKLFNKEVGIQQFMTVAKNIYSTVDASCGFIQNDFYERVVGEIVDEHGSPIGFEPPKGRARWTLPGLFWANFLGPEYVTMFGRERLLSAPCQKIEELPDGGLLLRLSESPFDAAEQWYQARKQELYSYLGWEAFTGQLLPKFRTGPGRKVRDAKPLVETGGIREDVFWHNSNTSKP